MNLKLPTVDTSKVEELLEDIPAAVSEDIENVTDAVKDKLINEGLDKTNEMTKNPVGKFILNKLTDLRESLTSKEANAAVDQLALQRANDFSFFDQPQMYQPNAFGELLLPLLLASIPMIQQSMVGNGGNTNAAPQTGPDSDYTYYVPEGTQVTDVDDIEEDSWGDIAKDGAKELGGAAANFAKESYVDMPLANRMMGIKPKPPKPPTTGGAFNAVKKPFAAVNKVMPKSVGGLAGLDMAIDMGKHLYDLNKDPSIAATMRNLGANAIDETRNDVIEWQRNNPMFSWIDPTIAANFINANKESWDAGKDTFREIGDSIAIPLKDARKAWNEGNYGSAGWNAVKGGWNALWVPATAVGYAVTHNPAMNFIKGAVNYGVDTTAQSIYAEDMGKQHDEREQTLNQLLVEMDGFGGNEGVIVMAATNRPDILDPALLRPGRFDRQVTVNYPDIKGREEILKVHARNKPLEDQVDLAVIAKSTAGFTGADLENLLNEAALLAARKGHHVISMTDIEESILKVILGPQKHSMVIKPEEKRKTAIHEAGHAIVSKKLKSQDPVQHISIIPSGRALGVTLQLPEEDKYSVYKTELIEQIAMLLGGRTAEELMLDDISGGASNDIQRATDIARKMVTQYGMSKELGPIVYGSGHDEVFLGRDFASTVNYSDEVAAKIDREILSIVEYAHKMARDILEENQDKLVFIADYLVSHETMDGEQFNLLMDKGATVEELEEIRRRKDERTREDNERCKRAKHEDASQSADTSDDSASEADETDDSSVDPGNS